MALGPAPAVLLVPGSPTVAVATAREPAKAPGPFSVAPMTATPATASPARRSHHKLLEAVTCSYFNPVEDESNCVMYASGQPQLSRDAGVRDHEAAELGRAARYRTHPDLIEPLMSGDRGSARLKSDARRVRIDEPGVGGQIQQCKSLGRRQIDWCRGHHRIGQRHDGADGAIIGWLAAGLMIGGGL